MLIYSRPKEIIKGKGLQDVIGECPLDGPCHLEKMEKDIIEYRTEQEVYICGQWIGFWEIGNNKRK